MQHFRMLRSNHVTLAFIRGITNSFKAKEDMFRWAVWVGRHTL